MLENAKENLRENAKAKLKIYPIKWTQQEEGFLENGGKTRRRSFKSHRNSN